MGKFTFTQTEIPGVVVIEPQVFGDDRGYFMDTYQKDQIAEAGIDNFPVFLMCGQLLFNFFNEATSTSMSSVLGAASLLKKVYIPKYVFPLEKCCFAMVNCVFSFVALALVMVFTGSPIHITVFEALYPLVTLFFFSLGVGLFLAAATVFFRDIMHIWSVFITALLYFSAIFYDPTSEGGIPSDDPTVNVQWPDCGCEHKTSAKDKLHEPFAAQKFEFFEKW